jgi:hypothetical protein
MPRDPKNVDPGARVLGGRNYVLAQAEMAIDHSLGREELAACSSDLKHCICRSRGQVNLFECCGNLFKIWLLAFATLGKRGRTCGGQVVWQRSRTRFGRYGMSG